MNTDNLRTPRRSNWSYAPLDCKLFLLAFWIFMIVGVSTMVASAIMDLAKPEKPLVVGMVLCFVGLACYLAAAFEDENA